MKSVKLVSVGDGAVGKTSMLICYSTNTFPTTYQPTVFDNYNAYLMCDGKPVNLCMWDTAGQEDYDSLRSLSYSDTDVFVIFYSIISPASYNNIRTKWAPELKHFAPKTPIILCGTKLDMRNDAKCNAELAACGHHVVTTEEGQKLAAEIGATAFMEASALTQENMKEMFDLAVRTAIAKRAKPAQQQGCGCGLGALLSSLFGVKA